MKLLLLLLIPIFFSLWWMITPQEMYVVSANGPHSMGGYYCSYSDMPTAFDAILTKSIGTCDVKQHLFHDNYEVINNEWKCTGKRCEELKY
jgi:hypothetical protein